MTRNMIADSPGLGTRTEGDCIFPFVPTYEFQGVIRRFLSHTLIPWVNHCCQGNGLLCPVRSRVISSPVDVL
jgi:hypothetical protein